MNRRACCARQPCSFRWRPRRQRSPRTRRFPTRPIKLVVPYPPGGPLDTAARALAEQVKQSLGTVVVENRPGAGGNIGVDQVAKSAPDGYTLVIGAVATHAVNPWLFRKLPYDPVKDFVPITLIAHVPNVLVMTPERAAQLKVTSARDLIDYLRRHPGPAQLRLGRQRQRRATWPASC